MIMASRVIPLSANTSSVTLRSKYKVSIIPFRINNISLHFLCDTLISTCDYCTRACSFSTQDPSRLPPDIYRNSDSGSLFSQFSTRSLYAALGMRDDDENTYGNSRLK